jgi:hypothetical protein
MMKSNAVLRHRDRNRMRGEVERLEARVVLDGGMKAKAAAVDPLVAPEPAKSDVRADFLHESKARSRGAGKGSGVPGAPLTIPGQFDPGARTTVTFADRSGHPIRMDAVQVTSSAVVVPVPIYFARGTLKPASGTVAVTVEQQGGAPLKAFRQFKIAEARKPGSAGTLASGLLDQTTSRLAAAIQNYQKIAAASGGRVDISAFVAKLRAMESRQDQMRQLLAPLTSGQAKQVVLGTRRGKPIVLNVKSLSRIDQILAASHPTAKAASVRVARAESFDAASLYDGLAASSAALASGGDKTSSSDGDLGALIWYDVAALSFDYSALFEGYTGAVLAGDSPDAINALEQDFNASGIAQIAQQDTGVIGRLTGGSGGSTLDANLGAAGDAYQAAAGGGGSINSQIVHSLPAIQQTLGVSTGGAPFIDNILPTTGQVTTTSGGQTSFQVKLNSKPTSTVTVPLRVDNPSEGKLSPDVLTFTPDDWNIPRTVTVTGRDDPRDTDFVNYFVLVGPAVSDDPSYNGLSGLAVPIINRRSDQAPPIPAPPVPAAPNLIGTYVSSYSGPVNDSSFYLNRLVTVSGTLTLKITDVAPITSGDVVNGFVFTGTAELTGYGSRTITGTLKLFYNPADHSLAGGEPAEPPEGVQAEFASILFVNADGTPSLATDSIGFSGSFSATSFAPNATPPVELSNGVFDQFQGNTPQIAVAFVKVS